MQQGAKKRQDVHLILAAIALLFASGCASPSTRIADALGGYGLSGGQALCLGQRLQANLSLEQLQQLARAAGAFSRNDTSPGRLTAADLLRVASQIEDPEIAIEVARAVSGCGILTSIL